MGHPQLRVAVVSTAVPPAPSGQARVLEQLIGYPPPENCLYITDSVFPRDDVHRNYRLLAQQKLFFRQRGWLRENAENLNVMLGLLGSFNKRAKEIDRYVREFDASVLVVCTASPFDLPASALVAARRRIPLVVHLFDDPVYQWVPGPLRTFARLCEPFWSTVARGVIVPNEAMQKIFRRRRWKRATLVRNPIAAEAYASEQPWPAEPGVFRIIYTGSVYHAQADAFLNLIAALRELQDWSLHIYTGQTEQELADYGIAGPQVRRHEPVDQAASYAVQRNADVLFLPLAFQSEIQEVLRSSAPMKMGEYLASGRPILAHAPADSFVVRHLRQHGAGIAVETPDPEALTTALRNLASDADRRQIMRARALHLAEDYRADLARAAYWQALEACRPARTGRS